MDLDSKRFADAVTLEIKIVPIEECEFVPQDGTVC